MPRHDPTPPIYRPLATLSPALPSECDQCHRPLAKKEHFVARYGDHYAVLCSTCITAHVPQPFKNHLGQPLIEVYNGIQLFQGDGDTVVIALVCSSAREARDKTDALSSQLRAMPICPACNTPVPKLEMHHWYTPPDYAIDIHPTCPSCNQRRLTPQIWGSHPRFNIYPILPPSHIMPAWNVQALFIQHSALLPLALAEYAWPLPQPPRRSNAAVDLASLKYWDDLAQTRLSTHVDGESLSLAQEDDARSGAFHATVQSTQ